MHPALGARVISERGADLRGLGPPAGADDPRRLAALVLPLPRRLAERAARVRVVELPVQHEGVHGARHGRAAVGPGDHALFGAAPHVGPEIGAWNRGYFAQGLDVLEA